MRAIKTVVMLLAVASLAVSSRAAQDLPFSDGFENQTNGVAIPSTVWTHSIAPIATNSPAPKDGSTLSVYAADGMSLALDNLADNGPYSNVWYHCYAKVNTHTNDPAVGNAVAGFFLTSSGELKAYSNNAWIVVAENVSTDDWLGFAVHLDYGNETWDLYRTPNGYTFGDNLVRQNGAPMAFNASYAHTTNLASVDITGETYVDAVVLSESVTPIASATPSHTNVAGSADGVELKLNESFTGVLLSYFGGSGTLSGEFGEALGSLLLAGDQVGIFVPEANPSWQMFTYLGPGQVWTHVGDNAYSDPTITPTTGIYVYLDPNATGTRAAAFVASFDTTADHTDAATTIYGTNTTARGWNMLSLPFTAGSKAIVGGNATQLELATAVEGDRIYLRKNGQWQQVITYRSGSWVRGRTPVDETFPAGSGFWYRRNATGTATWNSNNL